MKQEILEKLQDVFREVLENGAIVLHADTTANDVEGWDSLTHIQLVMAIEKLFQIKFTSKEILSWNNVGEIVESITKK